MDSLKQQIEKKLKEYGLHSVVDDVLGLVVDYEKTHVTILREKLRERLDSLMESLEPLTIGERKLIRDFKKELLGKETTP